MSDTTVRRPAGPAFAPRLRELLRASAALVLAAAAARTAAAQKISEVVCDHAGTDSREYVEVYAGPLANLSAYTLVELDGAADGDPGKVLHVFTPTTANDAGFWTTGYLASTLERPAFTILLVSGFTGTVGQDLDAGNDGVLDSAPWSSILDGVAFSDGAAGSRSYAAPVLGPGFDGNSAAPGGASRFPYWKDTDSATDWKRNDFDGDGLPGFTGTLEAGEARNTPGSVTRVHVADYWAGVDAGSPSAARTTIHAAIANHVVFPYSAGTTDVHDILNVADEDPTDTGRILDIYKNASYVKTSGGDTEYNKEHSWPKSYGFPVETTIPHSDCHHLFASDTSYNSNRSNKPFDTCSSGCTENATLPNHGFGGGSGTYPGNSNWTNGSVYEVWNHRRGDIARAQLYMDVRYEGGTHAVTGASEPDLVLTDNLSLVVMTSASPAYMGRLATLLQWHLEDPVDGDEQARNDVIESFQGNRNPFVDHPEWVACVFQGSCGGSAALLFGGLKSATDLSLCAATGVALAWDAPPAWNDDCASGCNRGFRVLRDGAAITSGGCAGPFSASATSCTDTTGTVGTTYAYAVEAFNHQDETSTGGRTVSAADRTADGVAPVLAAGPSASSAAPSSFTVTWTTDEPSDSRLEYGATASYGGTAYDATPVTTHSLTATGLAASTEYHFRAGSADACGNGPAWSSDGTVTTAAVSSTLDVGGYQVAQTSPDITYTLPSGTTVSAGGYVVIGRNAAKAAFETFWGVTLGPDVVYLNANNSGGPPVINGSETFTLKNAAGAVLDGPTIVLPATSQSVRRNDPCLAAGTAASWTVGASSSATPGTGAGAGCGTGLVINEFSDASNYVYEFVELHWDAPGTVPATPTASNGGPYCEGATIALSTPAVSGATYSWTGPEGFTSAQQNPTIPSATTARAGTYSVTVTVDGLTSAPGTTTVVVHATPATPSASNGGPYLEGATIVLSTPTVPGATYSWTGPVGFTSAEQNPVIPGATAARAGTYSVTVTVNGCTSAAGTTTVLVSPAPPPAVGTGAATDVTTTGATLNGTVNPNGAATTASFEWGATTSYGETTPGQAVGAGTSAQAVSAALTGLAPCATYHYRATATSVGGAAAGEDATFETACAGGRFYPLTPCRVLDTRLDAPMADGVPRVVTFHGTCGIPVSARAVAANFTATQSTLAGEVSCYPADVASTGTTVIPFAVGKTRASNTVVKLSGDGAGKARLEASVPTAGTVHVIVDVSGYFD